VYISWSGPTSIKKKISLPYGFIGSFRIIILIAPVSSCLLVASAAKKNIFGKMTTCSQLIPLF